MALLMILPALNALNISWSGGNGNWNVASNWSSGTVPVSGDIVYISNGTVTVPASYFAQAQGVTVHTNGQLTIASGGLLRVNGINASSALESGVQLRGDLNLYGALQIWNTPVGAGLGVDPSASFYIGSNGILNILNSDSDGISSSGTIQNNGYIYINNAGNHGIISSGTFTNTDKITVLNVFASGFSCWTNGTLHNSGEISVKGAGSGIGTGVSNIQIINEEDGEIYASYVDYGIILGSGSNTVFDNHGYINASWQIADEGINTYRDFNNHETGEVEINYANDGIYVGPTGEINNLGNITIHDGTTNLAILNEGLFHNHPCGKINVHKGIGNGINSDIFFNEGEIYNHNVTAASYNDGDFINDGLIEDNPGTLLPIVDNEEAIIKAITGYVQEGVPVYNVLDLNNLDHYIFKGFYTSANLDDDAGWYDVNQNAWEPNGAAVGLTEVYLQAAYRVGHSTLCNTILRIEIPGGVQSLSSPVPFAVGEGTPIEGENQYLVYPNPFQEFFNLKASSEQEGAHRLSLYNATGQQVFQQQVDLSSGAALSPNLPALAQGTYLLTLSKNGVVAWTKRLVKLP
jgi:hypothetical protein